MLKTIDEIKEVEIETGQVINGIDNANLMSVDSTESISTKAEEEKVSEGDIDASSKKEDEKETVAPKKDEEVVETEEKVEKTDDSTKKESLPESKPEDSKNVQKRIGKLTKKMRTAERERDSEKEKRVAEKKRITELEKKLEEAETKQLQSDKPKKTDFEDEDEYIEALTDWKIDLKLKTTKNEEKEVKQEKVEKKEETTEELEEFEGLSEALEKGREKYEDFDELTADDDLVFPASLAQIVLDTDNPEDIMYHLANDHKESKRLSLLSDVKAAREIGKLEVELKKPKKVKKQSKAPEPISSVKTDGIVDKDPEKMSPAEYRKWRLKS